MFKLVSPMKCMHSLMMSRNLRHKPVWHCKPRSEPFVSIQQPFVMILGSFESTASQEFAYWNYIFRTSEYLHVCLAFWMGVFIKKMKYANLHIWWKLIFLTATFSLSEGIVAIFGFTGCSAFKWAQKHYKWF